MKKNIRQLIKNNLIELKLKMNKLKQKICLFSKKLFVLIFNHNLNKKINNLKKI